MVFTASRWGHIEVVKELLNYGANIKATISAEWWNLKEGSFDFFYLIQLIFSFKALRSGHMVVKELLGCGANIKTNNYDDYSSLIFGDKTVSFKFIINIFFVISAFEQGHIQVFEELLARGANIDAQKKWGKSLLIDCKINLNYTNSLFIY